MRGQGPLHREDEGAVVRGYWVSRTLRYTVSFHLIPPLWEGKESKHYAHFTHKEMGAEDVLQLVRHTRETPNPRS